MKRSKFWCVPFAGEEEPWTVVPSTAISDSDDQKAMTIVWTKSVRPHHRPRRVPQQTFQSCRIPSPELLSTNLVNSKWAYQGWLKPVQETPTVTVTLVSCTLDSLS